MENEIRNNIENGMESGSTVDDVVGTLVIAGLGYGVGKLIEKGVTWVQNKRKAKVANTASDDVEDFEDVRDVEIDDVE